MSRHYASGIDISNHQGFFDWSEWNGFLDFGSVKATEGLTFRDADFANNWQGMQDIGIFRFAYHFGHPSEDPVKQAAFLVNTVKAHGLGQHDNFILDLEQTDGLPPGKVSFWAWVFCTTINRLTRNRILVYTYPAFAEAGNCAKLGGWGLWIANYQVPQPHVPPPWLFWRFWQFTDNGPRAGGLDLDRWNGDEISLAQFCAR